MNSKRRNFHFIVFLTIIILGLQNSFFITETSAYFDYSNPSTTPLWSYSLGNQFVSSVAISSDGTYITATCDDMVSKASLPENGKLYLFNNSISKKKNPLWNYSLSNSFFSVAISANGSYIIAGGGYSEKRVYLFNYSNPTPQWTYYTGGWVYDVEITEDGDSAAAASGSRRKVYLLNNKDSFSTLGFNTIGLALRVAFSSNGSYMAVTDNAARLFFFNTSRISPEWTYTFSGDMSTALSISADGNYIASGSDKKVYIFKKNSSVPIWTYQTSEDVSSIKISQDGNYIVAGDSFGGHNVYFFNRLNSIPEWIYSTGGDIVSVDISSNGDYIVALSWDHYIYLFNKSSSTPIWRYKLDGIATSNYDYGLEISSDGKYIVAGGRHHVYLFDRDIISAPKLNIPGYNLFIMFFLIGIMLLISVIAIFLNHKKIQRNPSNKI